MKVLLGTVKDGFGVAGTNLKHVVHLIEMRTGLSPLVSGTFNLGIPEPYIVIPDARIEKEEYNTLEFIKLQRCRIGGVQALIMRPNTHEEGYAHGASHLELMSTRVLRDYLGVKDGDVVPVEIEGDEEWWQGQT